MMNLKRLAAAGLAALGLATFSAAVSAQEFPTRAVRIITPFPVGAGPESVLRALAEKLQKKWGQPVIVENRPGGNGFIAISEFKGGATDGHDLIQLDNVHLGPALLESSTKPEMQHVNHKETSMLCTGVATGELQGSPGSLATAGPLQRGGKLKFIAVTGPQRHSALPDVPTVAGSSGPAGFEVTGWTTIAAPRGVPKAVTGKIQRDIEAALAEPETKERFATFGCDSFPATQQPFNAFIAAESAKYAMVIQRAQAALD